LADGYAGVAAGILEMGKTGKFSSFLDNPISNEL